MPNLQMSILIASVSDLYMLRAATDVVWEILKIELQ